MFKETFLSYYINKERGNIQNIPSIPEYHIFTAEILCIKKREPAKPERIRQKGKSAFCP